MGAICNSPRNDNDGIYNHKSLPSNSNTNEDEFKDYNSNSLNQQIASLTFNSLNSTVADLKPTVLGSTSLNRYSTVYIETDKSFENEYNLGKQLGEGGAFGITYECTKKSDKTKIIYAVKKISKINLYFSTSRQTRNELLKNMKNEISHLKKCQHSNIVKLYDICEDKNFIWLIMEYLSGGELFEYIINKGELSEKETANITKQILNGLDYMHNKQNIAHLDLKPANLMFDNKGNIKIIDFGMSQIVPRFNKLNDIGIGTAYYTAPEVLNGNYNRSADIWSLGVIVFFMVFGYIPFAPKQDEKIEMGMLYNKKVYELIKKGFNPILGQGHGAWFPISIQVSLACRNFIKKMLESDISKRKSVLELLDDPWIRGKTNYKQIPLTVYDSFVQINKKNKFKILISTLFMKDNIDTSTYFHIKKLFNKFDINNNGYINVNDFKYGMKQVTNLSNNELDKIFNHLDKNKDYSITFDELLISCALSSLLAIDERLYAAFNKLDTNNDGIIETNELKKIIKQEKYKVNSLELSRVISEVDKNKDGKIDFEDFLNALHNPSTSNIIKDWDKSILKSNGFDNSSSPSEYLKEYKQYLENLKFSENKETILDAHIRKSVLWRFSISKRNNNNNNISVKNLINRSDSGLEIKQSSSILLTPVNKLNTFDLNLSPGSIVLPKKNTLFPFS